jgi:hypothetical protein
LKEITAPELLAAVRKIEARGAVDTSSDYNDLREILQATNTPNYQGMFLRGYDAQSFRQNNGSANGFTQTVHSSGSLGQIQGDAGKKVTGSGEGYFPAPTWYGENPVGGVFYVICHACGMSNNIEFYDTGRVGVDFSRIGPTDVEYRPVNKAVRYLIKALK